MKLKLLVSGLALVLLAACGQSEEPATLSAEVETDASGEEVSLPVDPEVPTVEASTPVEPVPMSMEDLRNGLLPVQTVNAVDQCVEANLFQNTAEAECVGVIMETCPEDAFSTADMVACSGMEFDYWSARLSDLRNQILDVLQRDDSEFGADGMIPVSLTDQFVLADDGWHHYRETSCQFEGIRYRGGTMGRVTGSMCMNELTARRALDLEIMLSTFETE